MIYYADRVLKAEIRNDVFKGFCVWAPVVLDGKQTVNLRCPSCGEVGSLVDHDITRGGTVTPSVECPCGNFHEQVVLKNYTQPEQEKP